MIAEKVRTIGSHLRHVAKADGKSLSDAFWRELDGCVQDAITAACAEQRKKDAEIARALFSNKRLVSEVDRLKAELAKANSLLTHAGLLKAQEEHNQLRADLVAVAKALWKIREETLLGAGSYGLGTRIYALTTDALGVVAAMKESVRADTSKTPLLRGGEGVRVSGGRDGREGH